MRWRSWLLVAVSLAILGRILSADASDVMLLGAGRGGPGGPPPVAGFFLIEDATKLLLEDSQSVLLE